MVGADTGTAGRGGPSRMHTKAVCMLVEEDHAGESPVLHGNDRLLQERLWALLGPSAAFWPLSWERDQQRAPQKRPEMGDRTWSAGPQ